MSLLWNMMCLRNSRQVFACASRKFYFTSNPVIIEDEYAPSPEYPEIVEVTIEAKHDRKMNREYEFIKQIKTVEEKQIYLNVPKYYGFKCYLLKETYIPYNTLNFTQHVTRTHLIETNEPPGLYNDIDVDISGIKSSIEDAILFAHEGFIKPHSMDTSKLTKDELENATSAEIARQINRTLISHLSREHDHLMTCKVDYDSRVEASWFAGGMVPTAYIKRMRRYKGFAQNLINDARDRAITYLGTSSVALRHQFPLAPFMPYNDCCDSLLHVPFWHYDPRSIGITGEQRFLCNTPGWWTGDSHEFGILSYHGRGHLQMKTYNDPSYQKEALQQQAITSSFGWLCAQANLQGFTTFNDLTYPLATQTIITNGQHWTFAFYQLNTIEVHGKNAVSSPVRNVCWVMPEMKLYEEIQDGKLIGFNEDVLKLLVKLYINRPEERTGIEMKPFLSIEEKYSADYEDVDKRTWLEKSYKFLTSNRPRKYPGYEMYAWERIFKLRDRTMPMEARRLPFELFTNPWARKLSDRQLPYVPRALRPHVSRRFGRYGKMYYPEKPSPFDVN